MNELLILFTLIFVIYSILFFRFIRNGKEQEIILKYMKYITVVIVATFTIYFTLLDYLQEKEFQLKKEIHFSLIHEEKIKLVKWIKYNEEGLASIQKLTNKNINMLLYWGVVLSLGLLFMCFSELRVLREKENLKPLITQNEK